MSDRNEEFVPELDAVRVEIGERADSVWTRSERHTSTPARIVRAEATGPGGRVAIVDGCRTPFCKAGTELASMDVVDLSGAVTAELVERSGIEPEAIGLSVFGVVVAALHAPNLGREAVFRASLPNGIPGTSVNLACASSNRAITTGAEAILTGQCEVVLAGGAESLSNVPIQYSRAASRQLIAFSKARSAGQKLAALARLRPRDLLPVAPAIAEYSTGMTMGQAAEKMAKENGISRRAQDEIALLSHGRAAAAMDRGDFERLIVPTFAPPSYDHPVLCDNGVRSDSSLEALAKLPPVFDKRYGSVTAGNSSPLTDGAAAVLLMSEERADREGYEPLGFIRSWAYAGVDPGGQLLQGPAYAAPAALDGAGLRLDQVDLVEMHEAFAAQILSNLKAFASPRFASRELGRREPLGEVDLERFNIHGGSIAVGHPFGATGARITLQLLDALRRRDLRRGLLTVCAAGGVGFAMVVDRR